MQGLMRMLAVVAITIFFSTAAFADPAARIMVMDFQLNDLTELPNAPEELARIAYLSASLKQDLRDRGVELVPVTAALEREASANTATYLFDRPEQAARLAAGGAADYLVVGVALKPTYLFVYPRVLLIDIKTEKVVLPAYAQLESSWSDQNTTARTAAYLARKIATRLEELRVGK